MGGTRNNVAERRRLGPIGKPVALVRKVGTHTVYDIQNHTLDRVSSPEELFWSGYTFRDVAPVHTLPYPVQSRRKPLTVGYGSFSLSGNTPGRSWYDLETHASELSTIAPLWYQTDTTGTLTASATTQQISTVVRQAATDQIDVWPTVTLNETLPPGWASSTPARNLIQSLVHTAKANSYQGYTLDFENIGQHSGAVYAAFVSQLANTLHQSHLKLMVVVLPLPDAQYPYAALAQSADWLDLLAYPEYTTGTPNTEPPAPNPGPTAGLPWVRRAVHAALKAAPFSHIVLGIAPYGQSWTYTNNGFQSGATITDRTIQQSLQNQPGQAVWDSVQGELEITTGSPAVAPPAPLSMAPSTFNPAVQNLQFLLSAVLLRFDITHDINPSPPLATDGGYGSGTAAAVQTFQKDFGVVTATPGVYDAATASALSQAIAEYNLGDTISWDEDSQAAGELMSVAYTAGLGGISIWKLGYQSPVFWGVLSHSRE